jgi:hypothetical protein
MSWTIGLFRQPRGASASANSFVQKIFFDERVAAATPLQTAIISRFFLFPRSHFAPCACN